MKFKDRCQTLGYLGKPEGDAKITSIIDKHYNKFNYINDIIFSLQDEYDDCIEDIKLDEVSDTTVQVEIYLVGTDNSQVYDDIVDTISHRGIDIVDKELIGNLLNIIISTDECSEFELER